MARKKSVSDEVVAVAEPAATIPIEAEVKPTPKITDPEWNEYVLGHFLDAEMDTEGHPKAAGLMRVAELLLGPIINAEAVVVQAPDHHQGRPAVATARVTFRWNDNANDLRTFGGSADVYAGNTDPEFARHATASAETKAFSRACRLALRLRQVVSAEEVTSVPVTESGLGGLITPHQLKAIEKSCRDLEIDLIKFINSGKYKYNLPNQVPYQTATKMLEKLNGYLQDPDSIEDEIKLVPEHMGK